jgi:hypothetical protein
MRWAEHVARLREMSRILVGRPEGKVALGRPRRRWLGSVKIYLQEE